MITGLQKSQKMESQALSGYLDGDAKIEHQQYKRTGTLDKIQDMVLRRRRRRRRIK
jgi:hypothetical protein